MHLSSLLLGTFAPLLLAQHRQSYDPMFDQTCLAASWPSVDIGKLISPQLPDVELQGLLSKVDAKRIENIILKLVSFGTRHTLSMQTDPNRGIGAARDWIASEMRSYGGALKVEVQTYLQQPTSRIPVATNISNVLGRLEGMDGSGRVYVISGHYDSRVTDVLNGVDDAPGANDDASGVAGMSLLCPF
jgi:hypothetical protein